MRGALVGRSLTIAARFAGYRVGYARFELGRSAIQVAGLRITDTARRPILGARLVRLDWSNRALPLQIVVEAPQLTLGTSPTPGGSSHGASPLSHVRADVLIRDGRLSIETAHLVVSRIDGHLMLRPTALTTDDLTAQLLGRPLRLGGGVIWGGDSTLALRLEGGFDLAELSQIPPSVGPIFGNVQAHALVVGALADPFVTISLHAGRLRSHLGALTATDVELLVHQSRLTLSRATGRFEDLPFYLTGDIALGGTHDAHLVADADLSAGRLPDVVGLLPRSPSVLHLTLSSRKGRVNGLLHLRSLDGKRTLLTIASSDAQGEQLIGPLEIYAGDRLACVTALLLGAQAREGWGVASLHDLPVVVQRRGSGRVDGPVAIGWQALHRFLVADLAASDVDLMTPLNPLPLHLDRIALTGSGDTQALALTRATALSSALRLDAQGVAGTAASALGGTIDLQPTALPGAASWWPQRVRGRFTATHIGDRSQVAFLSSAPIAAASLAFTQVQARLTLDARRMNLAAILDGGGARALLVGDSKRGYALSGTRLPIGVIPHLPLHADVGVLMGAGGDRAQASLAFGSAPHAVLPAQGQGVVAWHADRVQVPMGTLRLGDAALLTGHGELDGLRSSGLLRGNVRIREASLAQFGALLPSSSAMLSPDGTLDADLALAGSITQPRLSGGVSLPLADVAGLSLGAATAEIAADPTSLRVRSGRVGIGAQTQLRFDAGITPDRIVLALLADPLDLSDMNTAFDPPDALAGTGILQSRLAFVDRRLSGSGSLTLSGMRAQNLHLGHLTAVWRQRDAQHLAVDVTARGASGHAGVAGDLLLAPWSGSNAFLTRSRLNLTLFGDGIEVAPQLARLDLNWPIDGALSGRVHAAGTFADPQLAGALAMTDGAVAGLSLDRVGVQGRLSRRRISVDRADLALFGLTARIAGTIDLPPGGSVALEGLVATQRLAALRDALDLPGPRIDGAVQARLQLSGTLMQPQLQAHVALQHGAVAGVAISSGAADLRVEPTQVRVGDAHIAFADGSLQMHGQLPLRLSPFAIGPADAPLATTVDITDLNLASFNPLLPTKTTIGGRFGGHLVMSGTVAHPALQGALQLAQGRFQAPQATLPLEGVSGALTIAQNRLRFTTTGAVQSGRLSIEGVGSLPSLSDLGTEDSLTAYRIVADLVDAPFALIAPGPGRVDLHVVAARQPGRPPQLSGKISLDDATVPLNLIEAAAAHSASGPPNPLFSETQVRIGLHLGSHVRVRGSGLDVGVLGGAKVGGTLGAPAIAGRFTANGGSVSYGNRHFQVDTGSMTFDPSDGSRPNLVAQATTTIADPDPDTSRNTTGQATVTLNVHGIVPDHLVVDLSSDPSYTRQQILGLLLNVSALGGVDFANGTPRGATTGNDAALPTLSQTAYSLFGSQVSNVVLNPLASALGNAVGLSDLAVQVDPQGAFGLRARRRIERNLSVVVEDQLGLLSRQSVGIDYEPNDTTSIGLSFFQQYFGQESLGATSLDRTAVSRQGIAQGVAVNLGARLP